VVEISCAVDDGKSVAWEIAVLEPVIKLIGADERLRKIPC